MSGPEMRAAPSPAAHEAALERVAHLEAERDRVDLLEAEKVGRIQRERDDDREMVRHYQDECARKIRALAAALDALERYDDDECEYVDWSITDWVAPGCPEECRYCAARAVLTANGRPKP